MALAGEAHVLLPLQHQLDRPAQAEGGQRGQAGPGRGLVLLAAEAPAQPQHLHLHQVHGQAQHPGHGLLHPRGPLGGRDHLEGSSLAGQGQRGLGFQVHVLLASGVHPPLHHDVAVLPGRVHVPDGEGARGTDQQALPEGLARVEHRRQLFHLQLHGAQGGAGQARGVRHDQGHRLPDAVHLPLGQQRLVGEDAPDLVFPRHIRRRERAAHPGAGQGFGDFQAEDAPVGHR